MPISKNAEKTVARKQPEARALALFLFTGVLLSACGGYRGGPVVEPIGPGSSDLTSASSASAIEYSPSKIIGINPLIPIRADGSNADAGLRPTLDAFGLIAMGNSGSCSGTHIGNGYVLSAGHCFLENSYSTTLSNQACPTVKVYWGYRGSPSTGSPKPLVTQVSQCTQIIHAQLDADVDFAIIKVDQPPKASVGIARESSRTPAKTKITIFGYPMGRPLEWSQYCAVTKSTVVGKPFNSESRMAHQCDTQPGNSGSSVIAVNKEGIPEVVAVHVAAAPDPIKYNVATYMFDVRRIMKKRGFDLDSLTFETPEQ
ncbi:MAG: trypsin-like peptidase domain-containing protein [Bdellovibrionales bacterium]|nr:trypsin-like peptidase domain-containing protein [Bdellovibrionales bacterium]